MQHTEVVSAPARQMSAARQRTDGRAPRRRRREPRALVAAMALLAAACATRGSAEAGRTPSPPATVAGFYEGSLHSREHGEVPLSVNLREDTGRISGTIMTPLGDFTIALDSVTGERLVLRFVIGDGEVGTISAAWRAPEMRGRWSLANDGGAIALRRVGPPRAPVVPAAPTLALSPAQWREDLRVLAAELPRRHGNAFHSVSRRAWDDSVRALDARLASLGPDEAFVALGRLVALVGDGHTYLELPEALHRFPVRLYLFGDTARITHVPAGHEHLLGARVLEIEGIDVRDVERLVTRQIAQENDQYVRRALPWHMVQAEVLHGLGIVPGLGAARWTVETPAGERLTVPLTPVATGERVSWVSAARATPTYRERPGEELWYEFRPESGTLFVAFRGYPPRPAFAAFWDQVFRVADEQPVKRLVIDLRENGGGDFTKTRDLVLPRLASHPLDRRGGLYVVIGRGTFSAAVTNAADFLRETNAILVGEPTGARPNGWQEKGQFTLPNSHLTVSVSTKHYRFLDEDLPAVMPHQHIEPSWAHFRDGRDPVLEWIEAQPAPARPTVRAPHELVP